MTRLVISVLRAVVCLLLTGIASCSGLHFDKIGMKLEKRPEVPPDPAGNADWEGAIDLLMGDGNPPDSTSGK